jgi:hypothetical protein
MSKQKYFCVFVKKIRSGEDENGRKRQMKVRASR